MINNLIGIIQKETEALKGLLVILEKQYKSIINKETFELDAIVDEIKLANREVAKQEVERRKLLNGKKVQDIINESGNKELDRVYREIKMVLESIKHQNETNDLLIKQQLVFTNRMLNIINPKEKKELIIPMEDYKIKGEF